VKFIVDSSNNFYSFATWWELEQDRHQNVQEYTAVVDNIARRL